MSIDGTFGGRGSVSSRSTLQQLAEEFQRLDGDASKTDLGILACAGMSQCFAMRRIALLAARSASHDLENDFAAVEVMLEETEQLYMAIIKKLVTQFGISTDE